MAILLLLIFTSCALNADQEASLNNAMVSYVNSRNNGAVMSYVAFTHPNAVAHYQSQGDSVFTNKFTLENSEFSPFLQDGNIREIESSGNIIHVKYDFLLINNGFLDTSSDEVVIIAISEDSGLSWFFIEEVDYFNDDIIEPKDRLITRE